MCMYCFCLLKPLQWLSCHLVLYSRFILSLVLNPAVMITVLCVEMGVEIIQWRN